MTSTIKSRLQRRARLALATLVLGATAALAAGGGSAGARVARPPPNVVLIQTDDQTVHELNATRVTASGDRVPVMPHTLALIRDRGINFKHYYDSSPLCAPSRASLLSGRYAHTNRVLSNEPPVGGYSRYRQRPIDHHNLAVWLQRAGYRTIHVGKFLNHYGTDVPETLVPPGWDQWQTDATNLSNYLFYSYQLNVNGQIEGPFGSSDYQLLQNKDSVLCPDAEPPSGTCNYHTDVLTTRAIDEIDDSAADGPFYLQLDYNAPHGDLRPPIGPEPATRYLNSAAYTPLPKPPDFNEPDVSDKPAFIRHDAPYLDQATVRRIRNEYRKNIESLRSVDDGVKKVVDALSSEGILNNTYIFFISDNGFFQGEHRLERAKFLPYEPAIHVPLLVRGPGIAPGSESGQLTANIDLAPTILRLAGGKADRSLEGHSIIPYWTDPSLRTRRPILLESFAKATDVAGEARRGRRSAHGRSAGASVVAQPQNYFGVRLSHYSYVEYQTGDRELYDLDRDPFELHNRISDPRYDRVQAFLKRQVIDLERCSGEECDYTTGPIPKPAPPAPLSARSGREPRP